MATNGVIKFGKIDIKTFTSYIIGMDIQKLASESLNLPHQLNSLP